MLGTLCLVEVQEISKDSVQGRLRTFLHYSQGVSECKRVLEEGEHILSSCSLASSSHSYSAVMQSACESYF